MNHDTTYSDTVYSDTACITTACSWQRDISDSMRIDSQTCVDTTALAPSFRSDIAKDTIAGDLGGLSAVYDTTYRDTVGPDTTCLSLDSLQIFMADSMQEDSICAVDTTLNWRVTQRGSIYVDTTGPTIDTTVTAGGDSVQLTISPAMEKGEGLVLMSGPRLDPQRFPQNPHLGG